MSAIIHNGTQPPIFKEWFDPNSSKWVWVAYPDDKVIVTSSWILPEGMTSEAEQTSSTVQVDGVTYTNANGIKINFNGVKESTYQVTNRVEFSDSTDDKSFKLIVRNT